MLGKIRRGAILAASLLPTSALAGGDGCVPPENVLRIDDRNARLFIQASEADINDLASMQEAISAPESYIRECQKGWGADWSLSFFSERQYAGYKDEEALRDYVASGVWEKAYLAEYDHAGKLLTRYPLQADRREDNNFD